MDIGEDIFIKKVSKEKTELSTEEILSICYNEPYLPHNRSDIYSLISVLKFQGFLTKKKNGTYLIHWDAVK